MKILVVILSILVIAFVLSLPLVAIAAFNVLIPSLAIAYGPAQYFAVVALWWLFGKANLVKVEYK